MQQLLALSPTNLPIDDLLGQFQGLTSNLALPSLDGLALQMPALPDLGQVTGLVAQFEQIGQTLSEGPQALTSALLTELQQLGAGSTQIGSMFGLLTETLGPLGGLPGQVQTFFATFDSTILPLLAMLQRQEFDAASLGELLPLNDLLQDAAQPLSDLLQAPLATVGTLEASLDPLAHAPWLDTYQSLLAAVAAVTPNGATTEAQLAALNQALSAERVVQVQQGAMTLETGVQTAVTTLRSFETSLDSLAQEVKTTTQATFDRLNPAELGKQLNIVDTDLAAQLQQIDLQRIVAPIDAAVQAVDKLVGQNLDQVTGSIEQIVGTVTQAIETARQALVQVSAIISDLLRQVRTFIAGPMQQVQTVIEQARGAFNTVIVSINQVLEKVNGVVTQVYTVIKGVVDQIAAFDFEPFLQQLYAMIRQITALLDAPQVRQVLDQVKAAIDQVVQKLDAVSLQPVFDQVLTNVDGVKTQLATIDTSQLNAMLRQALKAALDVVTSAIDPPSKVTDMVKEEYNNSVRPYTLGLIEPIEAQFLQILDVIDQFEPGTLVASLLTPPFETMIARLEEYIGPDQILGHLSVITEFYEKLLADLDQALNPEKLLAPITKYYGIMLDFVNGLSAQQLLQPLNDLLNQAKGTLARVDMQAIIDQVKAPVDQVVGFVRDFRLEEQPFWQPVQAVLNIQIGDLVKQFVAQLKQALDQIDLSALEPVTAAVRQVMQGVQAILVQPQLLDRVTAFVSSAGTTAQAFLQRITGLAEQWHKAADHVRAIASASATSAAFDSVLAKLEGLNPIKLLAAATNLVKQLQTGATSLLERVQAIWAGFGDLLTQGGAYVQSLLSGQPDGLKAYLAAILDGLVAGPLQRIVALLEPAVTGVRRGIDGVLKLQQHLEVVNIVPQSIDRIGDAVKAVQQTIQDFNLDFLVTELDGIMDTIIQPLHSLNPQPFIDALVAVYRRVLDTVRGLNPAGLIASARGMLTLSRQSTDEAVLIPVGARLIATTPAGQRPYRVIAGATLAAGESTIDVLVQAEVQGRGGEVIVPSDSGQVTWEMAVPDGSVLALLTPAHTAPLLSLYTMFHDVVIGKLQALHPAKLIPPLLNEPYQKILQIKHELGLEKLFLALFARFDQLEKELFDGLDRSALAFRGLLAAMPL